jgi:hypothetical protein
MKALLPLLKAASFNPAILGRIMKIKQSQTWLFAFTDLAFLLLISLSLIPSAPDLITIRFSEMDIPSVPNNPNMGPIDESYGSWELHVHQKSDDHPAPFRLARIGLRPNGAKELSVKYLDQGDLIPELESLQKISDRPVLLPGKTSLSKDFLYAAGAIARVWTSGKGQTIVKPINPKELHQ